MPAQPAEHRKQPRLRRLQEDIPGPDRQVHAHGFERSFSESEAWPAGKNAAAADAPHKTQSNAHRSLQAPPDARRVDLPGEMPVSAEPGTVGDPAADGETLVRSSVHGLPRIGPRRELKGALEGYWAGERTGEQLQALARRMRRQGWRLMAAAGVDLIPVGDFSLYDHVLDTICMLGAVPPRFGPAPAQIGLPLYFEMARGGRTGAMEMTKWFDTNYHHLVPELGPQSTFALCDATLFEQFQEATQLGLDAKPVLLGPVSFLLLAKPGEGIDAGFQPLRLLDRLLDVYEQVIARLGALGAQWLQLDEPCFAQDRSPEELAALQHACARLTQVPGRPKICVCTYFDRAGEALSALAQAPVEGVGLDLVRGGGDLPALRARGGLPGKTLFAGVLDARNVWAADLHARLRLLEELRGLCGQLVICTSSSLMHVPFTLENEDALPPWLRPWLAFAKEKVQELATLARALNDGPDAVAAELAASAAVMRERAAAASARAPQAPPPAPARRDQPRELRAAAQRERLRLPDLPTTTIGSFPQTASLRAARAALQRGELDRQGYEQLMREEIARVITLQERLGLDVLVHGEPERGDMVRYFAEQLSGFALTEHGWVQSYGSRCVRPPILHGEVRRDAPITLEWARYAQSLTDRPVKGMLTGPVSMLQWSFVRDDQPAEITCRQLALAVRAELEDLQRAGIAIVQVDEPAIREGLPLRAQERGEYLRFAIECFRLAVSVADGDTQVQTHMCYSDFGEMADQIAAMDADVLLIEAARSRMDLLEAFAGYPSEIGPGVWDIHSPRVPTVEEIEELLARAERSIPRERLWVNPDCGLKTRAWREVEPALANMVAAAHRRRIAGGPAPPI